jgi:hypothetical protein
MVKTWPHIHSPNYLKLGFKVDGMMMSRTLACTSPCTSQSGHGRNNVLRLVTITGLVCHSSDYNHSEQDSESKSKDYSILQPYTLYTWQTRL